MALYLAVLGCFVLAVASLLVWAARRGDFRDPEAAKHRVLELDRETGVKSDD